MDSSRSSKRFRRGKWDSSLIAPYQEIRIIPKPLSAFFNGKAISWKHSSIEHFTNVVKFTLFENGSFLHFVHRYMAYLPNVKYVQLRELKYDDFADETKYTNVNHAYTRLSAHGITWFHGMGNILNLETLRIRLFDRLAMLLYMNLFTFRESKLVNLELDFSKLYGLPLPLVQMNEISDTLSTMIEFCHQSLKQLRLKWAVRVDSDLDYSRSEDDIEPFLRFLLALRNPAWMKLQLQILVLTFPTVNLGMNLCDSTLVPFLKGQEESLKRVSLARVVPSFGIDQFTRSFSPPTINKLEFSFYSSEVEMNPQSVSVIRGAEILLTENPQIDYLRLIGLNRRRREQGLKYYMHLKLLNASGNLAFSKPDVLRLTDYFQSLRVLELLDNSSAGKMNVQFTSADFNTIVRRLSKLVSLKMTNCFKFTDVGITKIPERKVRLMTETGAFHLENTCVKAPVSKATELKFLELRDLTRNITDISVYFAFQHIKKLEKIAFHGSHYITSWGQQILELKHSRNPYFEVIFKSEGDYNIAYGNYVLPCVDFP